MGKFVILRQQVYSIRCLSSLELADRSSLQEPQGPRDAGLEEKIDKKTPQNHTKRALI